MKTLAPKARFKSLSKVDQYTVTARTLAHLLGQRKREDPRRRVMYFAYHIAVGSIDRRYLEFDPATGLLTANSIKKIKRATAASLKSSLGRDAYFMFAIEQQDKAGRIMAPHLHILTVALFTKLYHQELLTKLARVAGDDSPGTIEVRKYSALVKRSNELAWNEADTRRLALYSMKNDATAIYRSKSLLSHVHARFDELKQHHREPSAGSA